MRTAPKPQRISDNFTKELREDMMIRIGKGLANPYNRKEISLREATELVTRTSAWKLVREELRTKPKKR